MIFYLSVDAPPLGVEVEEVVGALLLAARLEDGPNFGKLICLGYVMVLVVVALQGADSIGQHFGNDFIRLANSHPN